MLPPAPSHRILIVTDAWKPQVNGVVRTLTTVVEELRAMGHAVEVIGPDRFRTVPCPTYPDISLSLLPRRRLVRLIEAFKPDALHIATEGPLGLAARRWAKRTGFAFTTAFHTRFAEYVKARTGHAGAADLCLDAPLPRRRPRHHGGDAIAAGRTDAARVPQHPLLVARRRPGSVQAVSARGMGPAAADLHLYRPGRGGEEHRRVPRPRSARVEGRGRRRPAAGVAAARLPAASRSPARATARRWPAPMPGRTCSCSPA